MGKFFRILLVWFFCLLSVCFVLVSVVVEVFNTGDILIYIIPVAIVLVFYLYMYGKVGWWMHLYKDFYNTSINKNEEESFFRDTLLPSIKSILGYFGYIIRPIIINVLNGIKKGTVVVFCAIPMLILSIISALFAIFPNILPQLDVLYELLPNYNEKLIIASWAVVAIVFFMNAVFNFSLKKCSKCGAIIKIEQILETEKKYRFTPYLIKKTGEKIYANHDEFAADKYYYEYYECKSCAFVEETLSIRKYMPISEEEYNEEN